MPAANRIHRELRRVMVDAEAHPAGIGCHVIDAIWRHLAEVVVDEVMDVDRVGTTRGAVIAAAVLVLADGLLLLGINRNDRLASRLKRRDLSVDVLELPVAIGMVAPSFVLRLTWRE